MSARKKRHSSLASTIAVLGPLESIAGREEVRVKAERERARAQRQAEFDATSLAEDAAEADRLSKKQARQDAKHRMDPALLALRAGLGLAGMKSIPLKGGNPQVNGNAGSIETKNRPALLELVVAQVAQLKSFAAAAKKELSRVRAELTKTKEDAAAAKKELSRVRAELTKTKEDAVSTAATSAAKLQTVGELILVLAQTMNDSRTATSESFIKERAAFEKEIGNTTAMHIKNYRAHDAVLSKLNDELKEVQLSTAMNIQYGV